MTTLTDIRTLVFTLLDDRFRLAGITAPDQIDPDFDLFESGTLDSLAFVSLMAGLEERLGIELDFSTLPTNQIANFTSFCSFVLDAAGRKGGAQP
jgi:acyl carrier protein